MCSSSCYDYRHPEPELGLRETTRLPGESVAAERRRRSPWIAGTRVVLQAVLAIAVATGPASAASFTLDPSRSSLVLQVFKDGLAARLGHDHVVRAEQFSGAVSYDAEAPEASSIEVEVVTASLVADDLATRRRFGLTGELSADDVAEITKAMKSQRQLDVARFPSIVFRSTAVTR